MSRLRGLAWLVAGCLFAAIFAVGLAPFAHSIPWKWEQHLATAMGADRDAQACVLTPQVLAVEQRLIRRLYPLFPDDARFTIEVHLTKNDVVNAYSALGGNISITSALLAQAQSPEELSGILAHEIEHVHRRHIMEGMLNRLFTSASLAMVFSGPSARWTQLFLNMDFTRSQEAQADEGALVRLQQAHIDNRGFRSFFERMQQSQSAPEFLSDHPSNQKRIDMVRSFKNVNVYPIMNARDWNVLKKSCR